MWNNVPHPPNCVTQTMIWKTFKKSKHKIWPYLIPYNVRQTKHSRDDAHLISKPFPKTYLWTPLFQTHLLTFSVHSHWYNSGFSLPDSLEHLLVSIHSASENFNSPKHQSKRSWLWARDRKTVTVGRFIIWKHFSRESLLWNTESHLAPTWLGCRANQVKSTVWLLPKFYLCWWMVAIQNYTLPVILFTQYFVQSNYINDWKGTKCKKRWMLSRALTCVVY